MRSAAIKIISYAALAVGSVLIAGCLYAIAQTEYAISAAFGQFINGPLSNTKIAGGTIEAGDFSDLSRHGASAFTNETLSKIVSRTDGHFIFNELISNSAGQIAYGELSNCAGLTHLYKNGQAPQCAWDYSIKVIYPKTGSMVTVYSDSGDQSDLAGTLQIPVPIAWSKNDKALILASRQIGGARNEIFVPTFSTANLASGVITKIAEGNVFFLNDYSKAVAVSDTEKRATCHSYGGNAGKITITDTETGKTSILAEEKNTVYHLITYDKLGGHLTYGYQADGIYPICDYADPSILPKKTIDIKP